MNANVCKKQRTKWIKVLQILFKLEMLIDISLLLLWAQWNDYPCFYITKEIVYIKQFFFLFAVTYCLFRKVIKSL